MKKMKMILPAILLVGGLSGCVKNNSANTYESLVTMDVNPGIQLKLDNNDRVVEAKAVNADAEVLFKDMDLTQADAKVAVNALLGGLVKEGYLTTENNTVLLSVENDDEQKRVKLERQLSEEIQGTLKDLSIEGAILSQDLDIDDDIEKLITKYDISYGKATLIDNILDEKDKLKTYTVEDLVKLSAQDLVLIYQQEEAKDEVKDEKRVLTGTVNTSKHISKEEALNIVLKDAGLTKSQIKELEVEYDSERGTLTYEIEFKYGNKEYDYEVNAVSGAIEKEVEVDDDRSTGNKTQTTTTSISENKTNSKTQSDSKKYTKDEALNIALKDAGLKKTDVKNLEIELDDNVYEIDFDYGNKEYSYDVHVSKGIIEKDVENRD